MLADVVLGTFHVLTASRALRCVAAQSIHTTTSAYKRVSFGAGAGELARWQEHS